jgi:DNA modification methylase
LHNAGRPPLFIPIHPQIEILEGAQVKSEIKNADCFDEMAKLDPGSFEHIITDPPYDAHTHANSKRGKGKGSADRDFGFDSLTPEQVETLSLCFAAIATRWVLVFCSMEMAHLWRQELSDAGLDYIRTMVWHKLGASPQFTGDRPGSHAELIVVAHQKGRKRWNGGGRGNVYRHTLAVKGEDGKRHPAAKPLGLMDALVRDFSDPGDRILDPFAGAGTTIASAKGLGRVGVGMEADPGWAAVARSRLERTSEQGELFGGARKKRDQQGALDLGPAVPVDGV